MTKIIEENICFWERNSLDEHRHHTVVDSEILPIDIMDMAEKIMLSITFFTVIYSEQHYLRK